MLGAVAFAAYALTCTRDLGGDDTVFATAVDLALQGRGLSRELVHLHHPLFNPLVLGVAWVMRLLGANPFVPDVGAWVAAAGAALTVGGLVPVLRRAGVGETTSLLTAALTGVSGGMWLFGTMMEVYTWTAAAVLLWLAVAGRERPHGVACGAALVGAMLGHLSAGLLVVPTAWRLRRAPSRLLQALVVGLGGGGLLWLGMLTLVHGAWSPQGWWELMFGGPGGYLTTPRPLRALETLPRLVLWTGFGRPGLWPPAVSRAAALLGSTAVLVVGILFVRGVIEAWRRRSPLAVTATLGLAAYVPLWLLWDAGNVEHMVAALPLFAALVAVGTEALANAVARVVLALTVAALAVINGIGSAVPASLPQNSELWVTASEITRRLPPGADLLAVGADPRLRLGLPYLSGRRVVDLTMAVEAARRQGQPPLGGLAVWTARAAASRELWALPDVLDPASATIVAGLGIPEEAWHRVANALFRGETTTIPADGVALREPFVLTHVRLASPPTR